MLKAAILAATILAAVAGGAQEDRDPNGLHLPERVTAGGGDQLLGHLSPDGKLLVYISTAEASSEVYALDMSDGRARRLFEEGAETTWPRVSPDGRTLLYISYREQAQGQLCVRDFPSASRRRCLREAGSLQAEWISPSRIALVQRSSVQGDLQLLDVGVGDTLSTRPFLTRSAASPTVSPDGAWLISIPVEREVREVGVGFAARTAAKLELVRVADPDHPRRFGIALPRLTAQPTFSRDGRYVYFVQFLADTNHDGAIDAADHGVVFRVPFEVSASDPAAALSAASPEQLTDERWNCQYPQAVSDRLLVTCAEDDSLDIFELPLGGEIPAAWDAARLRSELDLSADGAEQLLFERALLARAPPPSPALGLLHLVWLHLQRGEFDTARGYALDAARDESLPARGLGTALLAWVDHRRQAGNHERGREIQGFARSSRDRLATLIPTAGASSTALALSHLVRSEIAETLGDFATAREELESTTLPEDAPRPLLELTYERGDALYRVLNDRPALLALCRRLATAPARPNLQLRFARAFVRVLLRGLPARDADIALTAEGLRAAPGSELAYAIELEQAVRLIQDTQAAAAGRALLDLFNRETRPDRQLALMTDALERSTALDADRVTETLAIRYVEAVQPATAERQRAERLYRHALLGRAFRRRAEGHLAEARVDFEGVVTHTHSLEALVAALDLRLRAGELAPALADELDRGTLPDSVKHFGRAYLAFHGLHTLTGDAHRRTVTEAIAALRGDWSDLHGQRVARALMGALRHETYLTSGALDEAERAANQYAIALKGTHANLRLSAMLLGELGLLHTAVGNYRLALGVLDRREQLPYLDNSAGLAVRLARARALLHTGKEAEAATAADEAVAMTAAAPKLAEFRVLALDRAALYNLAARRFEQALRWYDEELPLLPASPGAAELRNSIVIRLAHAAAALGAKQPERALADVAKVKAGLNAPRIVDSLRAPHANREQVVRSYHLLATGLEANALFALGRASEAAVALEARERLFAEQLSQTHHEADERATALVEDRLAALAAGNGDEAAATRWAREALQHAQTFGELGGTQLGQEEADALWLAAELAAFGAGADTGDLRTRLGQALDTLATRDAKSWARYRAWFDLCLALTAPVPVPTN